MNQLQHDRLSAAADTGHNLDQLRSTSVRAEQRSTGPLAPLESKTTVSTCVDRVIEMHFPEFSLYSGSENVAILSDEATKIDIMHSLMFLHRKRLHCILDVSQISLRLTLLFLYDPILSRFLSYIVSQIILFWKSLSSQMGRRKPPNLLWPWRHYSSHS